MDKRFSCAALIAAMTLSMGSCSLVSNEEEEPPFCICPVDSIDVFGKLRLDDKFDAIKPIEVVAGDTMVFDVSKFYGNFNGDERYLAMVHKSDFCFDLMRKLSDSKANYMVSPLSMQMVLSLLANGADGETYDEITSVIGLEGVSREELCEYNRHLMDYFQKNEDNGNGKSYQMNVANSLWIKDGLPVCQGFLSSSSNFFNSEVYSVDFNSPSAVDAINFWAYVRTKGKIEKIYEYDMNNDLAMILMNAVYFKASWENGFDSELTTRSDFHNMNGKTTKPLMMHGVQDCLYASNDLFSMVSLPFEAHRLNIDLILPNENVDVNKVLLSLTPSVWDKCISSCDECMVNIQLPKFSMKNEFDLTQILMSLGLKKAFSSVGANFAPMSPVGLYVSKVTQNTSLDVEENCVEASAVSRVEMKLNSAGPDEQEELRSFIINRPFLFTIRDSFTGAVVFIGRVGEVD